MRDKRRLLQFALLGVMAFAAVMLAVTLTRYFLDRASYRAAQQLALSTPEPTQAATPEPDATPSPTPLETPPVVVDFDAIRAEGRRVRGWLYSEETVINYPVVYHVNHTYYLTHDYRNKRSNAGALFFDTRVGTELAGDNLIIYGHHMKDGSMFKSLLHYQKQDYYDAHPTMYLLTLDGNYRIDLFAARFTDSDSAQYPVFFASEEEKESFVGTAIRQSDIAPADAEFRPDTRIITLVTCAYSNYIEDAKYQVLGWLTPIG